jgi:uncharacterized protein YraI
VRPLPDGGTPTIRERTSPTYRPSRAAAVVGATVAVGAAGLMALVAGTTVASEPGRCTQNVNVRSGPDPDAPIVAHCGAGSEVRVGEMRQGFVQLSDLGGWASTQYVAADGAAPVRPVLRAPEGVAPTPAPQPPGARPAGGPFG